MQVRVNSAPANRTHGAIPAREVARGRRKQGSSSYRIGQTAHHGLVAKEFSWAWLPVVWHERIHGWTILSVRASAFDNQSDSVRKTLSMRGCALQYLWPSDLFCSKAHRGPHTEYDTKRRGSAGRQCLGRPPALIRYLVQEIRKSVRPAGLMQFSLPLASCHWGSAS